AADRRALLPLRRRQVPRAQRRRAGGGDVAVVRRAHRRQLARAHPRRARRHGVVERGKGRQMTAAFGLPFFQTAALAVLILAGIHAYLGFHIVRRGVLFVDLALAQMAALGVALALMLNLEHDETAAYFLALGMTFVGAGLFAWLRGRARQV